MIPYLKNIDYVCLKYKLKLLQYDDKKNFYDLPGTTSLGSSRGCH